MEPRRNIVAGTRGFLRAFGRIAVDKTFLICLLSASSLAGCATTVPRQPDLVRLYETARTEISQPPIILIPGLMGSRLTSESEGEIWPGSFFNVLFSRFESSALAIDPEALLPMTGDMEPAGITGKFAGRAFYSAIIETLESAGGFSRAWPGQPLLAGQRHYYIFTYDWRLDNVQTVVKLDQLIDQIRADHDDPDLKVDIIGHSMGGMIARYYMRYGPIDVTNDNRFPINYHGEHRVRRLILLGTPNLGSVEALKAMMIGRRIGLRRIQPETLITFPSFYQLLPHPLNDWLLDMDGRPVEADPFDIETWQRFGWSVFDPALRQRVIASHDSAAEGEAYLDLLERYFHKNLERGRRFMWSLTVSMERTPWQLVVYGGDCILTPARMVVEDTGSAYQLHLEPQDIRQPRTGVDYARLMLEPGDGVVTKASLLARESLDPFVPRHKWSFFPLHYPLFFCEEHGRLTNNLFFQNNLLNFLFD
ncbi:MAG: alpha/beta fold hydrolase, partial [Wenzhouxiangella sp.]